MIVFDPATPFTVYDIAAAPGAQNRGVIDPTAVAVTAAGLKPPAPKKAEGALVVR